MDYEIRNITFIVLYIYLDIYVFLGGGGEKGWDMRNMVIPHRYQILIWDRLSLIRLWIFLKNVLWLFMIIFLCLFFFIAMRHSCNSPCLLVANEKHILALDYDNKSVFPVVSNLSLAVDVDFHYNKGYIFWCDYESIQRSNMDGTNITVIHNDTYCYGLAVEWDSLQLYWTGYHNKTIMVSDLDGNNKRIVFSSLSGPADIVLDPHQGYVLYERVEDPANQLLVSGDFFNENLRLR